MMRSRMCFATVGIALFAAAVAAHRSIGDPARKDREAPIALDVVTDTMTEAKLKSWRIPNVGEAAEFYFSPDDKSLIGNAKLAGDPHHQVYTFNIDGTNIKRINDTGEDACSFYFPDGKRLLWTSTRDNLDMPKGNYSNPNDYPQGAELYSSDLDGRNVKRLTHNRYYEAEVTVSPDGKWIVFTRQVDGKLDLYRMRPDGTGEARITKTPDWQEGGAQYLPDSATILFRAWKITDQGQRGMPMTIFTIRTDGTRRQQITTEPGTNWAPFPAPDGRHFAFVKLLGHNWDIFMMNLETKQQHRLTNHEGFDGFPAISNDGTLMAFASSREARPGEGTLYMHLMDISSLGITPLKASKDRAE